MRCEHTRLWLFTRGNPWPRPQRKLKPGQLVSPAYELPRCEQLVLGL